MDSETGLGIVAFMRRVFVAAHVERAFVASDTRLQMRE
jgi:hypothetical protein